jgi:hypothetical protein
MQVKVTIGKNTLTSQLSKKAKALDQVPGQAFTYFRAITPIKTGNARRNTSLSKTTIRADYNYASRLDAGSSRQAPNGMSKPTRAYVQKLTDSIMKRK